MGNREKIKLREETKPRNQGRAKILVENREKIEGRERERVVGHKRK